MNSRMNIFIKKYFQLLSFVILILTNQTQAAPTLKESQVLPSKVDQFNFCVSVLSLPHHLQSRYDSTLESQKAFRELERRLIEDSPLGIDMRTQLKRPPHLFLDGQHRLSEIELIELRKRLARINVGLPHREGFVGYHMSGAPSILAALNQMSSLNAAITQARNQENFQIYINRNIKRAPLAPLAMLGSLASMTYSLLPSAPSVLLLAGSTVSLAHVCLKKSFVHLANTLRTQNKLLPQTLNSVADLIYKNANQQNPQSPSAVIGDRKFSYISYSLTLPLKTIQQAIWKSRDPESQIDLNHLVAFFAKLDTPDELPVRATTYSTDFQARRVEFDFYFDLNNPLSPELYIYVNVWENKICQFAS